MTSRVSPKLAILCGPDGRVLFVLRDDLNLSGVLPNGAGSNTIDSLLAAPEAKEGTRLLLRARQRGSVFGTQLNLKSAPEPVRMHIAALQWQDNIFLVAGSTDASELLSLLEECTKTHTQSVRVADSKAPSFDALDELTRLNNELVNTQRQLSKQNAELLALTKHRNELLAIAAHDLRNPLMVVQAYCDLLLSQRHGGLDSERKAVVARVLEAAELMQHVLEGTLDFARIEAGTLRLNLTDLSLETVVAAAVQTYRPLADQKGISLLVEKQGFVPIQKLDPVRMAQVVGNLVSNAIKYSPRNGTVALTIAKRGESVVLAVRDQGEGIQRDELPNLFQPFKTTSTRPTAGESSTGLGLAIVGKLVEAHGGKVRVDSEIGLGSTFEIELPIQTRGGRVEASDHRV